MREIKFRAMTKPSVTGIIPKMVYGTGIFNDPCNTWLYRHTDDSLCMHDNVDQKIINPDTIGQFTGLIDENGNEAYEGDIITYDVQDHNSTDHFYTEPIVWAGGGFACSAGGDGTFGRTLIDIAADDLGFIIIGNIHENPELLK